MTLAWLPYGASRGAASRAPKGTSLKEPTARPSPPMRPPALSLRPAVAIPVSLLASLLFASAWAGEAIASGSPATPNPPATTASAPEASHPFGFVEPVETWTPQVHRWADAYGLPVELVFVVMALESCGDPSARSGAGALGLFQVMPFHFQSGEDPLDPEVNAMRGLSYLRRSWEIAGGDAGLALAGYNGGHGVITRDPSTWAAETRRYVRWGTGILADLVAGRRPGPTFQAWLDAGGEGLCRRAALRASDDD